MKIHFFSIHVNDLNVQAVMLIINILVPYGFNYHLSYCVSFVSALFNFFPFYIMVFLVTSINQDITKNTPRKQG